MKCILICPAERPAVALLAQHSPLCAVPLLGQSLVEYWLTHLAATGVKAVRILAADRSEQVHSLIGTGSRWGMEVEVVAETRELTPAQVLLKHERELEPDSTLNSIATLEHFPGLPEHPLFSSYANCFAAMLAWMPRAKTVERVGVKQVEPGIWVSSHASISPEAKLVAPCWIGQRVFVGPGTILGPAVILDDRCFVERESVLTGSYVGADTFVGRYSEVKGSLALGSTLINWETNSWAEVPDPFLLCSLRQPRSAQTQGWLKRLKELYARDKAQIPMGWKQFLVNRES